MLCPLPDRAELIASIRSQPFTLPGWVFPVVFVLTDQELTGVETVPFGVPTHPTLVLL